MLAAASDNHAPTSFLELGEFSYSTDASTVNEPSNLEEEDSKHIGSPPREPGHSKHASTSGPPSTLADLASSHDTTVQTPEEEPNPFSQAETLHTSDVPVHSSKSQATAVYEESYRRMERADHEEIAAWAIHIALLSFCGLVVIAVLLSFLVIQNYGLVAMFGMSVVVIFFVFLAWFVDKTILSENQKLKPIRRKIVRVVEATKDAVVDEYNLFQMDWREHHLLTYPREEGEELRDQPPAAVLPKPQRKSRIFRLVKPLLGVRRRVFRRKQKIQQPKESSNTSRQEYEPPESAVV